MGGSPEFSNFVGRRWALRLSAAVRTAGGGFHVFRHFRIQSRSLTVLEWTVWFLLPLAASSPGSKILASVFLFTSLSVFQHFDATTSIVLQILDGPE